MRNWICSLLIAFVLLFSVSAPASYIYDSRTQQYGDTEELTIEKFWAAYGIAVVVYGYAPPPRGVVLVTSNIFQESIHGFYDLPTGQLWLNIDPPKGETELMHTLIHEIGHHLLTKRGVSIAEQHCLMYGELDKKALLIYGVPEDKISDYINPLAIGFYCGQEQ